MGIVVLISLFLLLKIILIFYICYYITIVRVIVLLLRLMAACQERARVGPIPPLFKSMSPPPPPRSTLHLIYNEWAFKQSIKIILATSSIDSGGAVMWMCFYRPSGSRTKYSLTKFTQTKYYRQNISLPDKSIPRQNKIFPRQNITRTKYVHLRGLYYRTKYITQHKILLKMWSYYNVILISFLLYINTNTYSHCITI